MTVNNYHSQRRVVIIHGGKIFMGLIFVVVLWRRCTSDDFARQTESR